MKIKHFFGIIGVAALTLTACDNESLATSTEGSLITSQIGSNSTTTNTGDNTPTTNTGDNTSTTNTADTTPTTNTADNTPTTNTGDNTTNSGNSNQSSKNNGTEITTTETDKAKVKEDYTNKTKDIPQETSFTINKRKHIKKKKSFLQKLKDCFN